MYIIKRTLIILIVFMLQCLFFVGCLKIDDTQDTSRIDTPNTKSEKVVKNTGNKTDTQVSSSLDSWLGDYTFSEYCPPDQNMFYSISVHKNKENYYAEIVIFGFQTNIHVLAKVTGDANEIKFTFEKYLPDNMYELYKKGDNLLRFQKRNTELFTTWGEIQPMIESNKKSGEVYFKKEYKY